jgi:hypothetical protein
MATGQDGLVSTVIGLLPDLTCPQRTHGMVSPTVSLDTVAKGK